MLLPKFKDTLVNKLQPLKRLSILVQEVGNSNPVKTLRFSHPSNSDEASVTHHDANHYNQIPRGIHNTSFRHLRRIEEIYRSYRTLLHR